ncbi:MAG: hypothetical protein RSB71_00760 [Bacilli bacterium]
MKKFNLLKVLGIAFLIVFILSWVIPAGAFTEGTFKSLGSTITIGLYDLLRTPVLTIATFIQYGLLMLAIGAFYGILNKTGVYSKLVDKVVEKWKKHDKAFLILTVVIFALLSSLTSLSSLLFVLVPFFVSILLLLNHNKITAFAATIGAMLVGQIGTTIGFNIWGNIKMFLNINMTSALLARIIFLVMIIFLFVIMVIKPKKEDKKDKKEDFEIPFYEAKENKKSFIPLIIISIITLVILLFGMYNLFNAFDINIFNTFHETITTFEINGYPIFGKLLGSVSQLGQWGNYDLVVILLFSALLIGWTYNLKFNEILEGLKNGMKKMLPTAFYAMMASIVFTAVLNMNGSNFVNTIVNKLMTSSENFSLMPTVLSSGIASFFQNDFYTLMGTYAGVFGVFDKTALPIIGVIIQSMYGLVMLIAPTSIFLLAGLRFMDIPYKEWIAKIWKYALVVLGLIIVVAFVLTMAV